MICSFIMHSFLNIITEIFKFYFYFRRKNHKTLIISENCFFGVSPLVHDAIQLPNSTQVIYYITLSLLKVKHLKILVYHDNRSIIIV